MQRILNCALLAAGTLSAVVACAQDTCPCPTTPPEPAWKVSVGGGLSLTGGNTNANSYNLSFSVVHDPRLRNTLRIEGLYLRTDQDGKATADRTSATLRDEFKLHRAYLLGQLGYLRDPLTELDYLFSPGLGAGYRVVDRKELTLTADALLGMAFEHLKGRDATSNLALSAGQRFDWQASPSVKLFEKASGLWKTSAFADSYYHFEAGLAAAVAKRLDLKLTFMDDYKNKPASATLRKNDTTFLAALILKM